MSHVSSGNWLTAFIPYPEVAMIYVKYESSRCAHLHSAYSVLLLRCHPPTESIRRATSLAGGSTQRLKMTWRLVAMPSCTLGCSRGCAHRNGHPSCSKYTYICTGIPAGCHPNHLYNAIYYVNTSQVSLIFRNEMM